MPCPVIHTRASGEKEKMTFTTADDEQPAKGEYIKWWVVSIHILYTDDKLLMLH